MPCGLVSLEEVFRTAHGAVSQCNQKNCYWLDFGGYSTSFRVNDFIRLIRQVEEIDLTRMICGEHPGADIEILMPFRSQRCFVLRIEDVINLQELLRGAKFTMELPGIIKDCLGVPSVSLYA